MNIVKQSPDQLIFEIKPSKIAFYFILSLIILSMIAGTVFYNLPLYLSITITTLLGLAVLGRFHYKYTITIDKTKDYFKINKNNSQVYISDYPLQQIQSIKTVVTVRGYYNFTFLIIVLDNKIEKIIEESKVYNGKYSLPFNIDFLTNRQAAIGKKISEFLNVPFVDSQYQP